jgi:hypothetical protein
MKFPKGLEPIDSSDITSDLSGVRNGVIKFANFLLVPSDAN